MCGAYFNGPLEKQREEERFTDRTGRWTHNIYMKVLSSLSKVALKIIQTKPKATLLYEIQCTPTILIGPNVCAHIKLNLE
jgi:hypothetical protein